MSYREVTETISQPLLRHGIGLYWVFFLFSAASILLIFFISIAYLFSEGVGIWGINIPVAWGFAITNFVWWIGIGHAGTFISAILLLLGQEWRTSINRFAEAMTLFAVACAGLFPILHLGRPSYFYWLFPYPDTMSLWPQFRSPLVWDAFAVLTYSLVSLSFWFLGLIPDLATLRDRAQNRYAKIFFGVLALGWRGDLRHWSRYEKGYLILAGLATPLVVSVHSIVSLDFAISLVPGWHSTVFPPYFVIGAIFSGFAMVLTLAIPLRRALRLQTYITHLHLERCGRLLLATSVLMLYFYCVEFFFAWFAQNEFEKHILLERALGSHQNIFWFMMLGNVLVPQLLWLNKIRSSEAALFGIAILVNLGMWAERYVIIVSSLTQDYLPSAWHDFQGTVWDWLTLIGSLGLFFFLFLLFVRILPVSSMFELKKLEHDQMKGAKQ